MEGLEDLPLVAQDNLFLRLDRESLMATSNVCVSWKKTVHDFTSRRISNVDSDLRDKLEKCGWIMSEHDVERCSCIDLYSSLFKLIGNVPMSCRELFSVPVEQLIYSISKSKLFFFNYGFQVFDLMQETMEPIEPWKELWRDTVIKAMHSHDKTLALIACDYKEDAEAVYEVYILNHETLQFVQLLNENSFKVAMGLTQEEFHTHDIYVSKIALAEDKLAVMLWIEMESSNSCQTQIWKLDTADPSTANIRYWKTIEHDLDMLDGMNSIMDFTMVMNSKLLCLAMPGHEKLVLDVLLFDDFSRQTVTVFEENEDKEENVYDFGIVIEDNCSKRVSVFDDESLILKVYEFDAANFSCLEVNLSQYAKESGVIQLNRFMMGKVMLLLRSDGKFKCILVTEDGAVVEGVDQQLQNEIHAFHVNADGIVAVTMKEFENYKLYFYN